MNTKILEMHNISKRYGGVHALEEVNFSLNKGEIHCLVGENGSGKSTLIKIISGVEQPEKDSQILINGIREDKLTPIKSIQNGIQVIYQDLSLFPNLTVGENIAINYYFYGNLKLVNWKSIKEISQKTIDKLNLSLNPDILVSSLSIADRQLVAICRAIATNAQLIIMDEPTSSLAKHEIDALFSVIKDLQRNNITILFVSHKLNEIMEISERVTILRDGKKIGLFNKEEVDYKKLTYFMTGKKITSHKKYLGKRKEGEILLEVKNLSKKNNYKDINFKLCEGEILGIIGLMGSGRTELALSLFGMNPPDSGEILVRGEKVFLKSNKKAINAGIGYLPEDRITQGLIMDQSITRNITVTIMDKLLNNFNMIDNNKRTETGNKWINTLRIKTLNIDEQTKTLSGGNQQKVVVAKWLATEPKILILDSPTVGVDIAAKDGIYKIIKELAKKNMGIILISDEVPEILYNCQYILLMRKGQIIDGFIPEEIDERKLDQKVSGEE